MIYSPPYCVVSADFSMISNTTLVSLTFIGITKGLVIAGKFVTKPVLHLVGPFSLTVSMKLKFTLSIF